jgi:NitT/TauT family transport system ATP-binding protein
MIEPAIALRDIGCTFLPSIKGGAAYTAVRDVSLSVADGEFVSVVGPTGCGKSTLLNVTAGLLAPTAGSVRIFGNPLRGLNSKAGYMFQVEPLMPWRKAIQNVMAGLEVRHVEPTESRRRATEWLERVGLGGRGDAYLHQLSGGMRKRVALAQILILEPQILLMDEPFGALDGQTRQLMENELLALWLANRKSVIFITHDLEEAISLSDRVVVMSAGPASHPIGEFAIELPRPRDVAEIRLTPEFLRIHAAIWETMRDEVLKGYRQHERA